MASFKLTLEYEGTDFEGWQRQPEGHRTVQAVLEAALAEIAGAPVHVAGAGRTDAGVHAEGQVAGVRVETRLDPTTLRRALNAKLPPDVVVRRLEPAPPDFDPRRQALAKHYRYRVWNGAERSPLRARRCHHVALPLDRGALRQGARLLEGRHDFACFQAAGSSVEGTVRTLHEVRWTGEPGAELVLDVVGSGFLRHMVRNLVGTLLEVGLGRRSPEGMAALLASRDRRQAGPTAPAHGLTLVEVRYAGPEVAASSGG